MILIKDVFHCSFEQLDQMDGIRMLRTLTILEAESMALKARSRPGR